MSANEITNIDPVLEFPRRVRIASGPCERETREEWSIGRAGNGKWGFGGRNWVDECGGRGVGQAGDGDLLQERRYVQALKREQTRVNIAECRTQQVAYV